MCTLSPQIQILAPTLPTCNKSAEAQNHHKHLTSRPKFEIVRFLDAPVNFRHGYGWSVLWLGLAHKTDHPHPVVSRELTWVMVTHYSLLMAYWRWGLIFRNPCVPEMLGLLRGRELRSVTKVLGRGTCESDGGHRRGRLLRRNRQQRDTVVLAKFWSQPRRLTGLNDWMNLLC